MPAMEWAALIADKLNHDFTMASNRIFGPPSAYTTALPEPLPKSENGHEFDAKGQGP